MSIIYVVISFRTGGWYVNAVLQKFISFSLRGMEGIRSKLLYLHIPSVSLCHSAGFILQRCREKVVEIYSSWRSIHLCSIHCLVIPWCKLTCIIHCCVMSSAVKPVHIIYSYYF